ncbi:hypothetical protein IU486_32555 [Streptomyces gardneri]|nr:hypothetical protein [Streptomyces gardneri]
MARRPKVGGDSHGGSRRFRDHKVTSWSFVLDADGVLVRCPRCDGCAKVITKPGQEPVDRPLWATRRLVCNGCGFVCDEPEAAEAGRSIGRRRQVLVPDSGYVFGRRFRSGPEHWGTVRDPFFQCPLWFQADCRGHRLWAYNRRHLEYLRAYVAAGLRERALPNDGWGRMTMAAKLPAWLKSAKNRAEVLRVIDKLRSS